MEHQGPISDRQWSKLRYEASKIKHDKKTASKSNFSTLMEAVETNLNTFEKKKKRVHSEKAEDIECEKIEYLLDVIPFITDYDRVEEYTDAPDGEEVYKIKTSNKNKDTFLRYLYHVEKIANPETMSAVCPAESQDSLWECECGGRLLTHVNSTACDMICHDCGKTRVFVESYTHAEQNEGMVYKRSNHLIECLNALQGKEGTNVPDEVIEAVRAEFQKNRVSSTSEITPAKVKAYLKKLGYSMYYENIHTIANIISGAPKLTLSSGLEKKFQDMFFQIQQPFFKHKPEKRKNFLSYNYVLYKFSELLGEDDLLPFFTLLKCQKNLRAQDQIWKKICEDLAWEYIPTT
jgi:hypothetical protein